MERSGEDLSREALTRYSADELQEKLAYMIPHQVKFKLAQPEIQLEEGIL